LIRGPDKVQHIVQKTKSPQLGKAQRASPAWCPAKSNTKPERTAEIKQKQRKPGFAKKDREHKTTAKKKGGGKIWFGPHKRYLADFRRRKGRHRRRRLKNGKKKAKKVNEMVARKKMGAIKKRGKGKANKSRVTTNKILQGEKKHKKRHQSQLA